jgi:hypothetical protein
MNVLSLQPTDSICFIHFEDIGTHRILPLQSVSSGFRLKVVEGEVLEETRKRYSLFLFKQFTEFIDYDAFTYTAHSSVLPNDTLVSDIVFIRLIHSEDSLKITKHHILSMSNSQPRVTFYAARLSSGTIHDVPPQMSRF